MVPGRAPSISSSLFISFILVTRCVTLVYLLKRGSFALPSRPLRQTPSTHGMRWPLCLLRWTYCASSIGFSLTFCVSLEAHRAITATSPFDHHQCPSAPRTPHSQILIFGVHLSNVLSVFSPPSFSPRAHCATLPSHLSPILSCNRRVVARPTVFVHQRIRVIWFVWRWTW